MTTFRARPYHEKAKPSPARVRARQRATYAAAGKAEMDLARYLRGALQSMGDRVKVTEIARLIDTGLGPGEIYSVIERAGGESVEAIASTLAGGVGEVVEAGAAVASAEMGGIAVATAEGAAVLDLGRPAIKGWLAESGRRLATNLDQQALGAVKNIMAAGVMRNRHPHRIARDIKQVIGLTERDAGAVARMRATLLGQGKGALATEAQVDRYADKLLNRRARTIAHTESMTAINRGREQLWDQLKEDRALPVAQKRQWVTGLDEMVCPICEPMHEEKAALGEDWFLPNGDLVSSPPAHPNCRCTEVLVI